MLIICLILVYNREIDEFISEMGGGEKDQMGEIVIERESEIGMIESQRDGMI